MATLRTKLILRNDSATSWSTVQDGVVLSKGEMAVVWGSTDTNRFTTGIKIGDGTSTFAKLPFINTAFVFTGEGPCISNISYDRTTNTVTFTKGAINITDLSGSFTDDDIVNIEKTTNGYSLSHAKKGPSATTTVGPTTAVSATANGTKYTIAIPSLTVDTYGHVNSVSSKNLDITIPSTANNVTADANLPANTIILGADNKKVQTSGVTIATTLGTDDKTVPTSLAVKTAINSINLGVTSVSITGDNIIGVTTTATTGAAKFALTHAKGKSGTVGLSANTTDSNIVNVPYITTDAYGHVTGLENHTFTITKKGLGLTSVLTYKGSCKYTELPTKDQEVGDVYNITDGNSSAGVLAGDNVCWNGEAWDNLGSHVDLSGLASKNHTHALSIAQGGTSQIALSPNTSYTLTAGGSTYVFTTPKDTNTTYSAGTGLSLSGTTFNVKTGFATSGKNYGVQADNSGNLYVNVPWTDTNSDTKYGAGDGLSLNGTTFSVNTGYTTNGKNYAVKTYNGNLYVNVPWTDTNDNTTYSAGLGLNLSGTVFSVKTNYTRSGNNYFVGADATSGLYATIPTVTNSAAGTVPAPSAANQFFLRASSGDPKWAGITVLDGGSAATTDWGNIS